MVEFIVPEAGEYVLVDHEIEDAYLGAVGHVLTPEDEGVTPDAAHRAGFPGRERATESRLSTAAASRPTAQ